MLKFLIKKTSNLTQIKYLHLSKLNPQLVLFIIMFLVKDNVLQYCQGLK